MSSVGVEILAKRYRILDVFCCAGGASGGYARAGFDMIGVDLQDQPNYQFAFYKANALDYLSMLRDTKDQGIPLNLDAIHASPPCQAHTALTKGTNAKTHSYLDLIPETRHLLDQIGLPYIIENVEQSTVRPDLKLCGEMFGLRVLKHRLFEISGFEVTQPEHIKHKGRAAGWRHGSKPEAPYYVSVYGTGGSRGTIDDWREAMEMPWAGKKRELSEAIPPAYCEYIGGHLRNHLDKVYAEKTSTT